MATEPAPIGAPRQLEAVATRGFQRSAGAGTTPDRRGPRLVRNPGLDLRFASTVTLLEAEPDLHRFLPTEQRAPAERFLLPLATVEKRGDLSALPGRSNVFGAVVLDGLLLQTLQLGPHRTVTLMGPGALVPLDDSDAWMSIGPAHVQAAQQTRLVLLGNEFLFAAHRWPWVVICLHQRMVELSARLTRQLAISQMPRVEDRVVAMLKLLAESWGTVTPAGISLQLTLTHQTLAEMIGARRPSVTLALKALAKRDAVIRRGNGWLLRPTQESAS